MQPAIRFLFAPVFLPVNLKAARLPLILKVHVAERAAVTDERRRRLVTLHEGPFQRSLTPKRTELRRQRQRSGEVAEEYWEVGTLGKRKAVEVQGKMGCFMRPDPRPLSRHSDAIYVTNDGTDTDMDVDDEGIDVNEESMDIDEVGEVLYADSDAMNVKECVASPVQPCPAQFSFSNFAPAAPAPPPAPAPALAPASEPTHKYANLLLDTLMVAHCPWRRRCLAGGATDFAYAALSE
ncbi:hypothetical protein PsYK624_126890 [Phanerochaete sordida]|uniref:Uncharacterized protein n=1 Tax=Phanerochaete sordida TaxID=48140 RepID=A0A9P3LJR9_9APHY|nr:hypothetical protein PsYK624_126890 [Phanerochaete sordida]